MKKINYSLIALAIVFSIASCKKKEEEAITPTTTTSTTPNNLGYNSTDDPTHIPSAINFGTGAGSLPASYSIVDKFPPIGDQGQYGTCVAWATGYNTKTALEGMDNGWTASQLSNSNNQLSARDLFTAIPNAQKGANCNGTNFTSALDVVLSRGVATLGTVPYTGLSDCSQSNVQSGWTTAAGSHKIKNYRKIPKTIAEIKNAIANNIPVLFGAKLADNFMTWNNDQVLSSNTTYNQVGQHAGHALVVAGYDDSKGPNGAFRVINSWSPNWGDAGYIWIDYNFFVNEFSPADDVYTATNDNGGAPPPPIDPTVNGSADIAAWAFNDVSTSGTTGIATTRNIEYNIYNIGDQAANSSQAWSVYYVYYNAYDANDYGFLFQDEINTSIAANTFSCSGNNCTINYNVPSGDDLANAIFGSTSIFQDYEVPGTINGEYYLLIIADVLNTYNEPDEQNNYFYTTDQYPVTFVNGVVQRSIGAPPATYVGNYSLKNKLQPTRANLKSNTYQTTVKGANRNSYSVNEIKQMIKNQRKSGDWDKKLQAFKINHKDGSGIYVK